MTFHKLFTELERSRLQFVELRSRIAKMESELVSTWEAENKLVPGVTLLKSNGETVVYASIYGNVSRYSNTHINVYKIRKSGAPYKSQCFGGNFREYAIVKSRKTK